MNLNLKILKNNETDFLAKLEQLIHFNEETDSAIEMSVVEIINQIKKHGDSALLEYTSRFDRYKVNNALELEIPLAICQRSLENLPSDLLDALQQSAKRIEDFHQRQKQLSWQMIEEDGTILGQKITAIRSVGVYVPGGKAVYPSSVLMNVIPAKVAGVEEIIMVVPTPEGFRNQALLAAAYLAGVTRIFTIGGAQAIAALTYGTATIPKVDKIVGPGNAYVASAKKRVFGTVGIDMVAGPSEILIIADESTPAEWVAMDLFSQAEHDENAQSILITTSYQYAAQVNLAINQLINTMPRKDIIAASFNQRGAIICVDNLEEACALANHIAPEHLELAVADADSCLKKIINAGAIFLGKYTSESLGDYCAGPNHVLPTSGSARFSSPLGVYDFQKKSSIIKVSANKASQLGKIAVTMANAEGLTAHAQSAQYRV